MRFGGGLVFGLLPLLLLLLLASGTFGVSIVTDVVSGVNITVNTASTDVEYFRIPDAYPANKITVILSTATTATSFYATRGWVQASDIYGYSNQDLALSLLYANTSFVFYTSKVVGAVDSPPILFQLVSNFIKPAILNITVEPASALDYPVVAAQDSFSVFSFTSNADTSNVEIISPVAQYVATSTIDAAYATAIAPSVSSSATKIYGMPLPDTLVQTYAVAATNPGASYFISHRRTSTLSALKQNITLVLSMPSAPLLFDSPGSMNVNLKAFRHKNAYLKLNIPQGRLVNVSMTVGFVGLAGDTIQVISSRTRWPNDRNGGTSKIIPTGSPTSFPISACEVDFDNGLVYLLLVYRPAAWTEADLNAGSLQVSANISFTAAADHVDLPANVTQTVPAGTTAVFRLTEASRAYAADLQLSFAQTRSSGSTLIGSPNAIGLGGSCIAANNLGVSWTSSTLNGRPCTYMDSAIKQLFAIVPGPATFGYTVQRENRMDTSGTNYFAFSATGANRVLGPADPALYPIIVRTAPRSIDFALSVDVYTQFIAESGCAAMSNYYVSTTWGYSDPNEPRTFLLTSPSESVVYSSSGGGGKNTAFEAAVLQTGIPSLSLSLSGSTIRTFTVPADEYVAVDLTVTVGFSYDIAFYTSSQYGSPQFLKDRARTTATFVNATLTTMTISGSGLLILPGGPFSNTYTIVFTLVTQSAVCQVATSISNMPALCVGRIDPDLVYFPSLNSYYADSRIKAANSTFALLYPAEYSANSACYNQFMKESCQRYIPRCDATGKAQALDGCSNLCLQRLAASGCSKSFATHMCENMATDCAPVAVLSDAPAAPPAIGYPPFSEVVIPSPPTTPVNLAPPPVTVPPAPTPTPYTPFVVLITDVVLGVPFQHVAPPYGFTRVYRVLTGAYTYSRLNVSCDASATLYLDQGMPYTYNGEYQSYANLNKNFEVIYVNDNPSNPKNYFIRVPSITTNANLTITLDEMPPAYFDMGDLEFAVINVTTLPAPPGATSYVQVLSPVATTVGSQTNMALFSWLSNPYPSMVGPTNGAALTLITPSPGVREYYTLFEYAYLASVKNVTVSLAKPLPPLTLSPNTDHIITLKANRPIRAMVPLENVPSNRIFDVKLNASVGSLTGTDTVLIGVDSSRWPSQSQYDSSVILTASAKSKITQVRSCGIDFENRYAFLFINYIPAGANIDYDAWLAGTAEVTITLNVLVGFANPTPLYADTVVDIPPSEFRYFQLADFATALETNAVITFTKNTTGSTDVVASTGSLAIGTFQCVGANSAGVTISGPTFSIRPCEVYDGGVPDVSVAIYGPTKFSYSVGSPIAMNFETVTRVATTTRAIVVGPSDPAVYPIVARVQPVNIEFSSTAKFSIVSTKSKGCAAPTQPRFTATYSSSTWVPYDFVIGCPSQALSIVLTDLDVTPSTFNVLAIRQGSSETMDITGPVSFTRTAPASSVHSIKLNLSGGLSDYTITINSNYKLATMNAPSFVVGSCEASTSTVDATYINEYTSKITITSSGTLVLVGPTFDTEYSVVIGPGDSDCSNSVLLSPVCVGRISEPVYLPEYIFTQSDPYLAQLNASYAALFPGEVATNSVCYRAYLEEICRQYIPRCAANGTQIVDDTCAADCLSRMATKGCSNHWAATQCKRSCFLPKLPFVPAAEPILPPAMPRPPVVPKVAPMSSPSAAPVSTSTPQSTASPQSSSLTYPQAAPQAGNGNTVTVSTAAPSLGHNTSLVVMLGFLLVIVPQFM